MADYNIKDRHFKLDMADISIVILNFNSGALTLRCVESVVKYVPENGREIVVVDNGSRADDYLLLERSPLAQHFRLVKSRQNTGFGAGNMLGANATTGRFLCFLNNDVVLTDDCISPLCDYLDEHPDVGCVTPVQLDRQLQHTRMFKHNQGIRHELFGDSLFERFWPERYPRRDAKIEGKPLEVMQLNGCFMLFPAAKFWSIGGFDTNIFLYHPKSGIICTQIRLSA